MGLDDTLDVWGLHGMGGVWGAFATGLFCTPEVNPYIVGYDGAFYGRGGAQLGPQVAGIVTSSFYSFTMTYIILEGLKRSPLGIRISEEDEKAGIDLSEHGQKAYTGGGT
jgi:Amt family ammonium transporter